MKKFNYFQPTEIIFGAGRVNEVGEYASKFGKRVLLVTTPPIPGLEEMYSKVISILADSQLDVKHFDQVQPNPTTENIAAGADMAKQHKAEVIIGLGGGSSMDTAKAIAVEATHEGSCWDYLFFRETQPTEKTLPVIAISTTSGTGSQVTQVAVITNTKERNKSAIFNPIIYPKVAIVDPELMLTVPEKVTAATGFDAFCHSFESILHPNSSPYTDTLGWEAIEIVINTLPALVKDLTDLEARKKMAYADTLAGLCIANAGVTLPHGVGMAISGLYPHIAHGDSLALIYPPFTRFTCESAVNQFAHLGRIYNPNGNGFSEEELAKKSCDDLDKFLMDIGKWFKLKDFGMPENEIPLLAKNSTILPDYKNNPRLSTDEEMLELITQAYG
ncbi:MAG: iron-containing alcohol dehydrogenase [Ignavibacteriaceae bacterium]